MRGEGRRRLALLMGFDSSAPDAQLTKWGAFGDVLPDAAKNLYPKPGFSL